MEIDPGVPPTPHTLTREEIFIVLEGTATVRLRHERGEATQGDAFVVPADTEFEVANKGDVTLKMVCCLPVGGQARTDAATFTPPWAE